MSEESPEAAAAEAAGVPRLRLTGVKKSFGDKAKRKAADGEAAPAMQAKPRPRRVKPAKE